MRAGRPFFVLALAPVLALSPVAPGCARPASPPSPVARYRYEIAPPPMGSPVLRVEATLDHAPTGRLVSSSPEGAVVDVALVDRAALRPLAGAAGVWSAPACTTACTLRYAVRLDVLASACRRLDCALAIGDSTLGSAAAWMLLPEPSGDAVIEVRVRGGDPERFATGLRRDRDGDGFVLRAGELAEASYTAFGAMRRKRLLVSGATLDVVLLGPPLSMGDEAALRWIEAAAASVARLFGAFPVDATVFVLPVAGADEVVFGRVMSLAGASVALLFGSETRADSAHEDWVVVHELFHLGTPSFVGEGHWLEEGLATYYEPILRARAGWMSEADLWRHYAREMRRGLRKEGDAKGLEQRQDIDSTYWGGALFALLADVAIRRASGGTRSLDDALRAGLARSGNATHVARVVDFLRIGDDATEGHVLEDLYRRYAVGGEGVDLDALLRSLGVGDELDDGAPLASVRRGILTGGGTGGGH